MAHLLRHCLAVVFGLTGLCGAHVRAQSDPAILTQPHDIAVNANNNATFTVDATGTPPLYYQWYSGTTPLTENSIRIGTTNATLTLKSMTTGGSYSVVVSNANGSVTSSNATLGIIATITSPPPSRSSPLGARTLFSAAVAGTGLGTFAFHYQWVKNGSNISGATSSVYTIANIHASDFGTYNLVVTNSFGSDTSADAILGLGSIACWGRNEPSQSFPPLDATNVSAISASSFATFSMSSSGKVDGWGDCVLPNPAITDAVALSAKFPTVGVTIRYGGVSLRANGTIAGWPLSPGGGLSNIVDVAHGYIYNLYLRRDGTIFDANYPSNNLTKIIAISTGPTQNLALRSDGTVIAWSTDPNAYPATDVPSNLKAVAIASGYEFALAIDTAGRVVEWGSSLPPVPYILTNASAPRAIAISASGSSYLAKTAMALLTNGTVVAWGDNTYQQTSVPSGLSNIVAISTGPFHNAALVNDGRPLLLKPPVGGTAYHARDFLLSAKAVGTSPLLYQWTFNGTNIPDATNSILLLTNVQFSYAGTYQLTVSNGLGVATSGPVPVDVVDAPLFFSVQPENTWAYLASRAVIGIPINGSGPLQIQWRFSNSTSNGAPVWHDVPNGTNEDLILDPVTLDNGGSYSVVASNSFGSITSSNATLKVRQVVMWGGNGYGQTNVPANLTNVVAVTPIDQSYGYSIALCADGTARSWSTYGPTALTTNIVEIAHSFVTTLALRTDGTVWGIPPWLTNYTANISDVVAIETDKSFVGFLHSDGAVSLVRTGTNIPPSITKLTNIVALFPMTYDGGVVGLRADGSCVTYGPIPVQASNVLSADIHNGWVALKRDGTVASLGRSTPGSNFIDVAVSADSVAAVCSDGTITNWTYPRYSPIGLSNISTFEGAGPNGIALLSTNDFPPVFLPDALDTSELVVSSRTSARWFGQKRVTHDGKHAARSAQIDKNTASSMRMLCTNGPVTVSFWWKVSSETNHDFLTFSIGGVPQTSISGEVDWQQVSFTVPAGPQMLVWTYSKDSSGTEGLDAGFVDELSFTPIAPIITSQPANTTAIGGTTAVLNVTASGTTPLTYRWLSTAGPSILSTSSVLTFPLAHRTNSGTYYVIVSNIVNAIQSSNAVLTIRTPQRIATPLLSSDGTLLLTAQDFDGLTFDASFDASTLQVQYSTNLIDWFSLPTQPTFTNGTLQLTDIDATNVPTRFYRVVEPW